jgi:short-subunit dehydrogenase
MIAKKWIVVSGGSKGIGRAILEKFAESGFDLITCGRSIAPLQALQRDIEAKFPQVQMEIFVADVGKEKEVKAFAEFVKSKTNKVEVLVNNAGLFLPGSIHDEEEGNLAFLLDTNLMSAYHLTRALIGDMKSRKQGHVFFISSTAGIMAYSNGGAYSITKHAMQGLAKALREEMKPHGVRVTTVLPGATYTSSWEGAGMEESRFMPAEDIAELVFNAYGLSARTVVEEILVRPQLGDI